MALKKFIYPFDLTGDRLSNRVEENHTLGSQRYRAFALKNGPFYAKNLNIIERSTGKLLKRGEHYECVFFFDEIADLTPGLEVCGVIVVHNTDVAEDLIVNANIVGGPFASSGRMIQDAIDQLELDNRNVYWENVLAKPDLFQPATHLHDLGDVFGFEFITDILAGILEVLKLNGSAQYELLKMYLDHIESSIRTSLTKHTEDKNNPHEVTAEQINTYTKEYIDALKQGIESAMGEIGANIEGIQGGLDSVNQRINGLIEVLNGNSAQLAQVLEASSRYDQIIADLNGVVDELKTEVGNVQNEIEQLHVRDRELQEAIEQVAEGLLSEKLRNDEQEQAINGLIDADLQFASSIEELKAKDTELANQQAALGNAIDQVAQVANAANSKAEANAGSINNLSQRLTAVEQQLGNSHMHVRVGGSAISGLQPGRNYLVSVYGVSRAGGTWMEPVMVKNSAGTVLAQTNRRMVNWPDGNAPQSTLLYITAPSDGSIYGFTDEGACWNMVAFSVV